MIMELISKWSPVQKMMMKIMMMPKKEPDWEKPRRLTRPGEENDSL